MDERKKAIPKIRDEMQSRVLVWVMVPMLAAVCLERLYMVWAGAESRFVLEALVVSMTFAVAVWALKAATRMAAVAGGAVCLSVMLGTGGRGLAPLLVLFVLTFLATRAGRGRKQQHGLAEGRRGRNAAQVIANLGVAGVVAGPVMLLAALAEATADTVSSEIGQAFGGRPVMLTTMRRVEIGTDGGVTLLGTAAGVAAGGVVAGVGMWGMKMGLREALVGFVGGVAGLVFDSALGATVERRGWVGNDWVNFCSTGVAVGVAWLVGRLG